MIAARAGLGSTPTVALLPGGDRFEDFHDKIGVSLQAFRDELTGGWLFNYVEALQAAGVRPVLVFTSARVSQTVRFTHAGTGASVCVLPSPLLHRKLRAVEQRWWHSRLLRAVGSYLATPVRRLAAELRREGCSAILCQEYEYARFDVCVVLGSVLRLPVFATYQGADHTTSGLERLVRPATLRAAAGLIIGADREVARVRRRYRVPATRIARIPNPLDVQRWRPVDRSEARRSLAIPPQAKVVEWHGRVQIERKGLDVLADAWTQLCEQRPHEQLLLLLVGTGSDAARLRSRLDRLRQGSVVWVDRYLTDREELWRHLSAADVSVLPSRHEGFAVALIEAMSCGLPVVATDVPGVADILVSDEINGGLTVPSEDPGALAAALGRLLDDPPWAAQMGARARLRAEQAFSLRSVGRQLAGFMALGGASRDGR